MNSLFLKSYLVKIFCGLMVLLLSSCKYSSSRQDTITDVSLGENPEKGVTDCAGMEEGDDIKERTKNEEEKFATLYLDVKSRNSLSFKDGGAPIFEEFDPANWKDVVADTDLDMQRYGNIPSNIAQGGLLAFSDDLYYIVRNRRIYAGFLDTEEEWLVVSGLKRGTRFLNFHQNQLYYVDTNAIWRYTPSGGELVRLNIDDIDIRTLFVFDNKLYFSGRDCCLYAYHLSSGELTTLVKEPVLHFSVCDQWLTWISEDKEMIVADMETFTEYRTGIETHTYFPSYHHRHLLFCSATDFKNFPGGKSRSEPVSFVLNAGDKQMVVVPATYNPFTGIFRNRLAIIEEGAWGTFVVMSYEPDPHDRRAFRWRCIREGLPLVNHTSVYAAYFAHDKIFLNESMDYFYYRYYDGPTGVVQPTIAPELLEDDHPWKEPSGYELERGRSRIRVPEEGLTISLVMADKNGEPHDPASSRVNFGECKVSLVIEREGGEPQKIATDVGSCTAKLAGYGFNTVFLQTLAGEAGGLNVGHYLHMVCIQQGECIETEMLHVNLEGTFKNGFFFNDVANLKRFAIVPYDESFFEEDAP